MRFQTLYVDMRPVLLKWLGIVVVLASMTLLVSSVRPDLMDVTAKAQAAFQTSSAGGSLNFGYWDTCLRSSGCLRSYAVTWSAPVLIKAFILGGLGCGLLAAACGMVWRPEVIAMRDTRVNAVKIDDSRLKSPTAPRGLL
ncbi:hypothetical protein [Deinococcus koreensis]|uniref:Uncharacterized protein n=1 Tax=Deinococcus koreensis TaxID=2054903 RepID=A0A2K3US48_9DEIO|nr:hypothetical protein [Deinococcus koreensis]PNY79348.1 hypothetical protein CVO96_19680 [Deinococcus koreensis]